MACGSIRACIHRLTGPACLAVVSVALAGCSNMSAVDRRIDHVLGEASGRIRAPSPAVRAGDGGPEDRSLYDEQPPTDNPTADELVFQIADQERDVLARLQGFYEPGADPLTIDLTEAFRIAQRSGREYLAVEEDYIFAVISLLIERHLWGPRFFDDISATIGADSVDGSYDSAVSVVNELRVTQRLPYGGDVEARLVSELSQEIVSASTNEYTHSTSLVLSADFPLLRNAGQVARESRIQAERDVVYAARSFERFRRSFLVSIASDYFDLVAQAASIANQQGRLVSVERLFDQRKALVEAGRRPPFDARNVQQNVERSRATLSSSRESYRLALDRFKVRLGLPVDREVELAPVTLEVPEPDVTLDTAARAALTYRLDYQNAIDRVVDQRRAIANARNQLLPDLDVAASAILGTDDDPDESIRPEFDLDDTDYNLSVTFGLPLDREIERLQLRRAQVLFQRARRNLDQTRDNIIVSARAAVREIERARFDLELQEVAIEINELRLRELKIKEAEIDAQQQLDAEDELLQSQNDRDNALRDLRVAVLNYLLTTGQMRVRDDGAFQPLRGMGATRAADPAAPAPGPRDPAADATGQDRGLLDDSGIEDNDPGEAQVDPE